MPKQTLPIANGFYVSESLPISAQRCVNFYPSIPQVQTVTDANLFGTPGIEEVVGVSEVGFCRGAHVFNTVPYWVLGQKLFRMDRSTNAGVFSYSLTEIGEVGGGVGPVTIADNGRQMVIVAKPLFGFAGATYVYQPSGSYFEEVTDPSFNSPAGEVMFVDGYFVFNRHLDRTYFHSPLGDARGAPAGVAYNAADRGAAEADPDPIRGTNVYRGQWYALGSETFQVFRNVARVPNAFQSIQGAVRNIGILAPLSVINFSESFFFVGQHPSEGPAIYQFNGQIQKISTIAIESVLGDLSARDLDAIISWAYSENGAYFVGFRTSATTFVYDLINGRWHERLSTINGIEQTFRVAYVINAYGETFTGDATDTRIGRMSKDIYTEFGETVRRFVISQPFDNLGYPIFVSSIEPVIESGVGLLNGENGTDDPQITMRLSYDGGRTFGNRRSRSLGKIGDYRNRTIFYKVNRIPREVAIELEISAPVKAVIRKLEADISG